MQTQTNNNIFTIAGVKNDGKTTLGKYLLEQIDKPSIIIDIANQFTSNTAYRIVLKGLKQFEFYFSNEAFKRAFYKGKLQVIYRFNTDNEDRESHNLFAFINSNLKNICIFCEELELYADSYLRKSHALFKTMYLSRNKGYTLINVIKEIGSLSKLIRSQTDYFFLGRIKDENAIKFFNGRSYKRFEKEIKELKFREFLYTDLIDTWQVFTLNKNTIKLIK